MRVGIKLYYKKSFTLVEILIVVAIIATLAGLAVPNVFRIRLTANEHQAISNLQTISVAAQTYWSVDNNLPYSLSQLSDGKYIDTILGCATSTCTKSGYVYGIGGTGLSTNFFIYTVPQFPNVSGIRSFCSGSDGVVRFNPQGMSPSSQTVCTNWEPN